MDGSSKVSRLTPVKLGAALVVAGVLSIGAAACGSGSSSDSAGSASVAKKEAGVKGIGLRVINQGSAGIELQICGDGRCQQSQTLSPGESNAMSAGQVDGSLVFPQNGDRVEFSAGNPFIGEPYIELRSPGGFGGTQSLKLSEGERRTIAFNGYRFDASRESDTGDYKSMTLAVGG
jgi:hypothetical protein